VVEQTFSLDTGAVGQLAEARSPADLFPIPLFPWTGAIGRFCR
jgi:hypothetical protein